jgi:hypothetical protein
MYTVRTQFDVQETTYRIGQDEFHISDGKLEWSLKTVLPHHVLTVSGFMTEDEALEFVSRLPAALAQLLLTIGIPIEVSLVPIHVIYFPDPVQAAEGLARAFGSEIGKPIDGCINGSGIAVYPTEKNLQVMTGGKTCVYVTSTAEQTLKILLAGANLAGAVHVQSDPKLSTALKLYGAYFTEQSATARFLTLIMSLEALVIPTPQSPTTLKLLNRWMEEVQRIRQSKQEDIDADEASLEALERSLKHLSKDSIRTQIRKLVARELTADQDVLDRAKDAVKLYDLRSTLVHTGYLDPLTLNTATTKAKSLVQRVLSSRFQRVTSQA